VGYLFEAPDGALSLRFDFPVRRERCLISAARAQLRSRDHRKRVFASYQIDDADWAILLDLYVHTLTSRSLSVSSICIGSGLPLTTALRHVTDMEAANILFRERDPVDARRSFVRLTPDSIALIEEVLREGG
jgi:DNA repair protein RadC